MPSDTTTLTIPTAIIEAAREREARIDAMRSVLAAPPAPAGVTVDAAGACAIERRAEAERCAVGRCAYALREALGLPRDESGDEYVTWEAALDRVRALAGDAAADLDALEAVMRDATPGPWRAGAVETWHVFVPHPEGLAGPGGERVALRMNEHHPYAADARALVAAVNAVPTLVAEVRRLRAVRDAAEAYGLGLLAMDALPDDAEPNDATCASAIKSAIELEAMARALVAQGVPRG